MDRRTHCKPSTRSATPWPPASEMLPRFIPLANRFGDRFFFEVLPTLSKTASLLDGMRVSKPRWPDPEADDQEHRGTRRSNHRPALRAGAVGNPFLAIRKLHCMHLYDWRCMKRRTGELALVTIGSHQWSRNIRTRKLHEWRSRWSKSWRIS